MLGALELRVERGARLPLRELREARERRGTLTVMGGPNYPLVESVQESFLRGLPHIDVYVDGPTYEGERAFLSSLRALRRGRAARRGPVRRADPGHHWIDRADRRVRARRRRSSASRDLDEIPSPYLLGWMDPFLATGYFPMMQIARGCPFTLRLLQLRRARPTAASTRTRSQNVKADLLYLAERIRPEITLCFADDNFGMYAARRGDRRLHRLAAGPLSAGRDTSARRPARTTASASSASCAKRKGALPMTAAVQSMNPQVLKNIKRDNIKLETYRQIQEELDRQGMQCYGELILCLPGETQGHLHEGGRGSARRRRQAHLGAPADAAARRRAGQSRISARSSASTRASASWRATSATTRASRSSRWRRWSSRRRTFTFQDYLDTRVFHLLLTIYYYEGNYEEAFALAQQHGAQALRPDRAHAGHARRRAGGVPPRDRRVPAREPGGALHVAPGVPRLGAAPTTRELVDGTLGGNLLSKYSMLGRFYATLPSLDFLELGHRDRTRPAWRRSRSRAARRRRWPSCAPSCCTCRSRRPWAAR